MAVMTYTEALGEHIWLERVYASKSLRISEQSSSIAVVTDNGGNSIELIGENLTFRSGRLTGGVLSEVRFLDASDDLLASVTDFAAGGAVLFSALKSHGLYGFMDRLMAKHDTIIGTDLGDNFFTGSNKGNDTILAGAGDDWLRGSPGNNTFDGGDGYDQLWYSDTYYDRTGTKGLVVDVAAGTVKNCWGGTDTFSNIEEIRGTRFNEVMRGSSGADSFHGLGGRDTFDGRGGFDTIRYEVEAEFGGKRGIVADFGKGTVIDSFGSVDKFRNIEQIAGTKFADKFFGDAKANSFQGMEGKDSYDGKGGTDAVELGKWGTETTGAIVDLSRNKNQIINDGFGNTENAKSIEAVGGTILNDRLTLGNHNWGWAWGNSGDDRLIAGNGANQWFGGGNGADTFVFRSVAALSMGGERDHIDDFSRAQGDKIDLSGISGLTFIGTSAFSETAGEMRYEIDGAQTILSLDMDGDGTADRQLALQGNIALIGSDFVLV
jgi:serralysin